MARILEDEQESEDAVCPCCDQPLLVEINVVALPDGRLAIKYLKLAHKDTATANALQTKMDRLRRR